jgi:hypothetical protein
VLDLIHIKTNRHAWGQCGRDAIVQPPLEQGEVMMRLEPSEPTGPLSPIPILGSLSPCADCGVAKEADHRIANHLAMLAGYVSVKASAMQEDPALISRRDAALMLQAVRSSMTAQLPTSAGISTRPASHFRTRCLQPSYWWKICRPTA